MRVGTKSVLFGVHCFLIHPFMIALGWWTLFGFPWDPRLWFAFFLHDLGYLGKPNMDGPEGEEHPYLGARIMGRLFDRDRFGMGDAARYYWYDFTLLHSRYLAKRLGRQPSRLAMADKAAIYLEPSWLYLPRAIASGEINDYYEQAVKVKIDAVDDPSTKLALWMIHHGGTYRRPWIWHDGVKRYMRIWVAAHRDGQPDTMTNGQRGN